MAEKKVRLSLADRIRAESFDKISKEDLDKEKKLIQLVTNEIDVFSHNKSVNSNSNTNINKTKNNNLNTATATNPDTGMDSNSDISTDTNLNTGMDSNSDTSTDTNLNTGTDSNSDTGTDIVQTLSVPVSKHCTDSRTEKNIVKTIIEKDLLKPLILTEKQTIIYNWFLRNGLSGYLNRSIVSKATNLPQRTVKYVLSRFETLSIIKLYKIDQTIKLRKYRLNPDANVVLFSHDKKPDNINYNLDSNPDIGSDIKGSSYKVVSKSLNKTNLLTKVSEELEANHNIRYWKNKNLLAAKVVDWMQKLNISFESMIESLSHCAFDLTIKGNKDAKGKPIEDSNNWFYRRIETENYYMAPANYKTMEEQEQERELKRIEEQEEHVNKMKELRLRKYKAENDIKFEKFLENDDSNEFKICVEGLSNRIKLKYKKSGLQTKDVLAAFRKYFDEKIICL